MADLDRVEIFDRLLKEVAWVIDREKLSADDVKIPHLDQNQDFLRFFRKTQEFYHHLHVQRAITLGGMRFFPELPLLFVPDGHLQVLCNKFVAIYHTGLNVGSGGLEKFLLNARGNFHKQNINFNRFTAKYIKLENVPRIPPGPRLQVVEPETLVTAKEAIELHAALLARLNDRKALLAEINDIDFLGYSPRVEEDPFFAEQYKIEPLFKALIILVTHGIPENEADVAEKEVQLVRTGVTEGLSEPISFDSLGKGNCDVVRVPMIDAIRFIQELGEKEGLARDRILLDPKLGSVGWYDLWSKYYGRKIQGPSEEWWGEEP